MQVLASLVQLPVMKLQAAPMRAPKTMPMLDHAGIDSAPEPHQARPDVEVCQTRQVSEGARPATAPSQADRPEKRRTVAPDGNRDLNNAQLTDDGPRSKKSKMDIAQILVPTTIPLTNGRDWFLPDRPVSAILQPPAEAGFPWNFRDRLPPGAVWIEELQERVHSLHTEPRTDVSSFTLLVLLKCDDSWVLVSVSFETGAQCFIEFFDPLHNGDDNDALNYGDDAYAPLELFGGGAKDDSGISVCLAAMHVVSGTPLPEESDLLLARRLLFRLFGCAALQLTPLSQPAADVIGVFGTGDMVATTKELYDNHVERFREKVSEPYPRNTRSSGTIRRYNQYVGEQPPIQPC
ncbi:hypothetical protein VMCG_07307 [Cytospora schulzeri]|uniref:Uncharacterized protein n=1 Tax=Cytospora schulzeri TaxID=448051 RepID=A0A423WAG3_9PEZI|nr:hypothetical protein VMCG_07307 [Valsa malicola]